MTAVELKLPSYNSVGVLKRFPQICNPLFLELLLVTQKLRIS
jgi:hypothetical protein